MNFDFILEAQGPLVITTRMDPWPTHRRLHLLRYYREAERPEKRVLRRFHVAEKIRVMDDPRHVRLRKLDATHQFELKGHAPVYILDRQGRISNYIFAAVNCFASLIAATMLDAFALPWPA